MAKWKCTVCGYIHEGDTPPETCPVCKQPKEKFVKLEEESKNPYAGTKTEKNLCVAIYRRIISAHTNLQQLPYIQKRSGDIVFHSYKLSSRP